MLVAGGLAYMMLIFALLCWPLHERDGANDIIVYPLLLSVSATVGLVATRYHTTLAASSARLYTSNIALTGVSAEIVKCILRE